MVNVFSKNIYSPCSLTCIKIIMTSRHINFLPHRSHMLLHITSHKTLLIAKFQEDSPGVRQGNTQGKVPSNLMMLLS